MDMSLSKLWEIGENRDALHAAVHGVLEWVMTNWLNNNQDKHAWISRACMLSYMAKGN